MVDNRLLNGNGCACLFKSLLEGFSLVLRNAFLNHLRSSLNEVLCVLKAKAGDLTDCPDNVELLSTEAGELYVKLGLLLCSSSGSSTTSNCADIEREVLNRVLTTDSMTLGPTVSACMALYKSSFLKENNLRFDEEVKNSEDVIFSAQVAYCAASFYYIEEAGIYCYFYNEASISKGFKPDRFEKLKNLSYACEKLFEGKDNGFYDKQLAILRWYIVLNCISERDKLPSFKEKRRHCLNIANDKFTKEAKLKTSELNVPLKMKLLMICVKLRLATVIALV